MRLAERATSSPQARPGSEPNRPDKPGRSPARRRRRRRGIAFLPPLRVPLARWGWGLLVTATYVLATVAMTWPYAARLDRAVPPHEDPLLQVWIARWVQHALVTDPLHLYDANAFYPLEHTLAYSDSNVPVALLMAPVYLLTGNAILAYNLLVLGTFVLAAGEPTLWSLA